MKFLLLLVAAASYELKFINTQIVCSDEVPMPANYVENVTTPPNYVEKITAVNNLWEQYLQKTPGDLNMLQDLFEKSSNIYNHIDRSKVSAKEKEALAELQHKIQNFVAIKTGQMITNILNGIEADFSNGFGFGILLTYNHYKATNDLKNPRLLSLIQMVDASYIKAIDNIYDFKSAEMLAASVQQTYTNAPANDYILFEFTVNAQLYLYWKFVERHDVNDLYLLNVGYYFNVIQKNPHFEQLDVNTKRRLQNAINNLPTSVQNLYFETKFCLLNKAHSEYIYTTNAIEIDKERRYIFTWTKANHVGGNGAWIQNLTSAVRKSNATGPQLNLTFALESYEIRMFLYLEQNVENFMNLITAWRSGRVPEKSSWSLELVENQLVFSQNGYIMCASEKLHSPNRRFVYGYHDEKHTTTTAACQWMAGPCPNN